jgi:hypothetical protein
LAVNELITGVGIAPQRTALAVCNSFDRDRNGLVAVGELIAAVNASLRGCAQSSTR